MFKIILTIVAILFGFAAQAQEQYVQILPLTAPENHYESFGTLFWGEFEDGQTDDVVTGCVLTLNAHEMKKGQPIELDEGDQQLILMSDGVTWLSIAEILEMIDIESCSIPNFEAGQLASALFFMLPYPYAKVCRFK